ncbi:MAG: FKBP-type peptidyl-prolyl cis-trans isomerase [Patescibacteria group bacterium]|nr:FKBP-type peptidyl-prolyl cis-trans isomerase [Patescibacteria group bacterium]
MKKNLLIFALALLSLALGIVLLLNQGSEKSISSQEAKNLTEKFINENLLPPGMEIAVESISLEKGLYKMSLKLADGNQVDSYLTKDGTVFFPEGIDIAQFEQMLAEQDLLTNNSADNQMPKEFLQIEVLQEGSGEQMTEFGNSITVHYTGTLTDGSKFDSSLDRGEPFTFTLGSGQVIAGWDQGLTSMKVGEKRKLTIPYDLAYGERGQGSIPPYATLIFEVELISIN